MNPDLVGTLDDDHDGDRSTIRRIEASGYVSAYVATGSESVDPVGESGCVELQPWGDEISVGVDVRTFDDDRVQATATLSLDDAQELRDELDSVLAE